MDVPGEEEWKTLRALLEEVIEQTPKALRQIAAEVGVTHPTLLKITSGETGLPYPKTRARIRQWLSHEVADLGFELTKEQAVVLLTDPEAGGSQGTLRESPARYGTDDDLVARTIIANPNTLRRALGVVDEHDMKTRIAILRVFEEAYLEAGVPPKRWPSWFHELRDEVYGQM